MGDEIRSRRFGMKMDFPRKTFWLAIVLVAQITHLFALQDTPENRAELADRLMRTFPVQEWWESAEKTLRNLPNNKRDLIVSVLRHMNWEVIAQAMRQTMIEIYSADELQALVGAYSSSVGRSVMRNQGSQQSAADSKAAEVFFSSPIGQSILRKQAMFLSKVQPVYKQEIMRALAIAAQEASGRSQ